MYHVTQTEPENIEREVECEGDEEEEEEEDDPLYAQLSEKYSLGLNVSMQYTILTYSHNYSFTVHSGDYCRSSGFLFMSNKDVITGNIMAVADHCMLLLN